MTKSLERVIPMGLLAVIIFTALAHGAVEPWSVVIFELTLVLLLLGWGLHALARKEMVVRCPRLALPLLALFVVGLVQGIALTNQAGQPRSLSMDVEATRQTTTLLFFLLLALLLAANTLTTRQRLKQVSVFLIGYGFVMAIFGLVQHFAWDGRFYWLWPTTDLVTSPFGPFVAHNHFAGYMELLLPLPIALAITRAGRIEARIFYLFAGALMGGAALASLSRGGFISLFVELLFLAIMAGFIARKRRTISADGTIVRRRKLTRIASPVVAALVTILAIGASIYWIGLEPVLSRIAKGKLVSESAQEETLFVSRGWIWQGTWAMIQAHPLTGVGLGTFETTFPIYSQSDGSLLVGQAHNDLLQIVAEAGILGGLLTLWFLVLALRQAWRGMRLPDPWMAGLSLGGGASVVGMTVHSLFDFNLQLPSHALLLVFIAALLAQASLREVSPAAQLARVTEPAPELSVNAIRSS